MKLVNRHILLFVIVFSAFLGVLKLTMPQHINAVAKYIPSKEYSVTSSFEKSQNVLLIEDGDLNLRDAEDSENYFPFSFLYVLIVLSYLKTDLNITNIFFPKNQKKHTRERDKYQLYLSLQVPL